MVVCYFWNISLSEALYPSLAALEVALRNGVHDAITAREGTDLWFRNLLEPRQLRDFSSTCVNLFNRLKRSPTTGQIVAELNFGFWTTLLSQPYHQTLWAPNNAALLRAAFPHLPPTPNARRFVHGRYNSLRHLRNRVMHYEPVWDGLTWNKRRYPIDDLHADILESIGWISPDLKDSIALSDRFTDVYQNGRARIEGDIKAFLSIS